jgi:hypothetical protein
MCGAEDKCEANKRARIMSDSSSEQGERVYRCLDWIEKNRSHDGGDCKESHNRP